MSFSEFTGRYSPVHIDESDVLSRIQEAQLMAAEIGNDPEVISGLIRYLDLTTLNTTDTAESVSSLARKGIVPLVGDGLNVAAVCVFPNRVQYVREILGSTGIHIASVAGGFPSGMTSAKVKLQEVRYAIEMGADEIDLVICRGDLLSGSEAAVYDEIAAGKEECGGLTLKVIIETCDLGSAEHVRLASMIALHAGADFIKTSTGKGAYGATPEHAVIMLNAIREFHDLTGKSAGFKASGGISDIGSALLYLSLVRCELGHSRIDPSTFRIGASSLLEAIREHKKNAG